MAKFSGIVYIRYILGNVLKKIFAIHKMKYVLQHRIICLKKKEKKRTRESTRLIHVFFSYELLLLLLY